MFDSLDQLLPKHLGRRHLHREVEVARILSVANEVLRMTFGEGIERKARAAHIKDGTLLIECMSSVLAQEIRRKEIALQNKLLERASAQRPPIPSRSLPAQWAYRLANLSRSAWG